MRRRDTFKRARQKTVRSTSSFPSLPYIPKAGVVGMVSIKTIKDKNGHIIIKQGERINENTLREEGVLKEILANAMPGKTSSK